jgi:hypothetical protein
MVPGTLNAMFNVTPAIKSNPFLSGNIGIGKALPATDHGGRLG